MPFVKFDTGILQSSLWFEKEQRELFITALLMAVPRGFDESIEQINVDRLEKTGWSAPPGMYGFVAAAGSGIIRMAMVDPEKGLVALHQLGEPDRDSRSNEYDGRRMIRMNGGYVILNYMKYREYDYTAAERMKRYRARQKLQRNYVDVTVNERHSVTQAEAEAEAERKKSSLNGSSEPCQTALPFPVVSKRKKSPMMNASALEELAANPAYEGLDVYKESHKFKIWCEKFGKNQSVRRFVNWLNRAA